MIDTEIHLRQLRQTPKEVMTQISGTDLTSLKMKELNKVHSLNFLSKKYKSLSDQVKLLKLSLMKPQSHNESTSSDQEIEGP